MKMIILKNNWWLSKMNCCLYFFNFTLIFVFVFRFSTNENFLKNNCRCKKIVIDVKIFFIIVDCIQIKIIFWTIWIDLNDDFVFIMFFHLIDVKSVCKNLIILLILLNFFKKKIFNFAWNFNLKNWMIVMLILKILKFEINDRKEFSNWFEIFRYSEFFSKTESKFFMSKINS